MLADYAAQLADYRARLASLARLAHEAGETDLEERVEAASQRLARRRFQIAVVGEFKAGKSTLINSLVSEDILPVDTKECTAVVCHLRSTCGEESPGATLVLANGDIRDVPTAEAKQHLTVSKAQFHGHQVEEAEIRVAGAGWLGQEVDIVDTPGVNASGQAREKATLSYLPNADAIIFMTRADQLLNETEMVFLKERIVNRDLARVFVVINFADRVRSERDRRDVLERARRLLEPFALVSRTYLISARDARDAILDEDRGLLEASGVPDFQRSLQSFIENDRAAADLARFRTVLESHFQSLRLALNQRLEASTFDREAAGRRRERILELIKLATDEREAAESDVRQSLRELGATISVKIKSATESMARSLDRLNASSKQVSESEASLVADREGGSAMAAIQGCLRDEAAQLQSKTAARMSTMFGKVEATLSGNKAVVIRPLDYHAMIQVCSTSVQEDVQQFSSEATTSELAINAGTGAIIGAIIGGLLFGPIGYYAGGAIGAGAAGNATLNKTPILKTVKKWVTHSKVNKEETVKNFADALHTGAEDAIRSIGMRITNDIQTIVRAKVGELHRRMDECELQEKGTFSVDVSQIKSWLERLAALGMELASRTPATVGRPTLTLPVIENQ